MIQYLLRTLELVCLSTKKFDLQVHSDVKVKDSFVRGRALEKRAQIGKTPN